MFAGSLRIVTFVPLLEQQFQSFKAKIRKRDSAKLNNIVTDELCLYILFALSFSFTLSYTSNESILLP